MTGGVDQADVAERLRGVAQVPTVATSYSSLSNPRRPPIRSICSHAFATMLVGSSRTPMSARPGASRTA
jgi:hypothetical protein